MSQHKHYTVTDIERYHSGQLPAAEMHAMEKAALDDPFLADALEGYVFTKTPANDLTTLQQKLQHRLEKENDRRGVLFLRTNWMRVAALFILIAGGGWLVFQTFSGNRTNNNEVAISKSPQRPNAVQTQPATHDSTSVFSDGPVNDDIASNNAKQHTSVTTSNNQPPDKSIAPLPSAPPATLTAPVQNQSSIRQMDAAEVYTLRQAMNDSQAREKTVASAKELRLRGTDSIKDLHIVLTPTGEEPETVVMNRAFDTKVRARRQNYVIDSLEPAEGWTRFDDYIANNLKTPDEFKTKPVKGVVELAFDLNKEGEPVNITVVKSLCEKCDEEAIRLLKEGPKWKKNKKKGTVKIKF